MQIEEFRRNRFIRNFIKDKWLIFASTGVVTLFAVGYVAFVYKPAFSSEAKVWIKDTSTRSYLSQERDEPGYLSSLTSSGNPVMTQSEILMSREMEKFLAGYVIQEEARQHQGKPIHDQGDAKKIIKVKTEPNTDIIQVQLKWDNPKMAQNLLSVALQKLDDTNLDINRQIYAKKRSYIDEQLDDIQAKLLSVRERIKHFQTGNNAVDMDSQTQELVRLKTQLTAQLETALAAKNNNSGNARALQSQLSLAPRDALRAVALGSGNENLVKMRSDLAALKQQYAHDSVKEAPTNPHLVALKNQIETLESQVSNEVRRTVGKNAGNGPLIFDNVRSQLVQDLAASNARTAALGAEVQSLSSAIVRVDASLKAIPESRFTLTGLQEEEKALALAYDEMRKKQIEVQIKEAETPSNVFVVDAPSLPERASFPTNVHILLMSVLLGLGAGMGLSVLKTGSQDRCEGADAVEEATRTRVLGVIPWLDAADRLEGQSMFAMNDLAGKQIISNLRIEASKLDARVIGFTSSALEKPRSGGAYYLAQCMAALGQTVAFIDADLRPSQLYASVVDSSAGLDLTDLILSTDLKLRSGQPVYPEDVLSGMMQDANGIYMALNRNSVANAFDYFSSKGFRHILNVLKEQFDWVFIDTPPASIAPEFLAIAHISDGVVLFADKFATYQTLRKIAAKVREAQVPLIGAIAREQNERLEWEHEVYSNWRGPGRGGGSLVGSVTGVGSHQKKRVDFMGAKIDALTMEETLARISEMIERREPAQHVVVNVAKLMSMRRNRRLRQIVNNSDLVNADGAGIVLGAKLLGIHIPERVAGIDLMHRLVGLASQRDYRIFFLGAEEDVVRDVVTNYRRLYPDLQICGYQNGYYPPENELEIAHKIRDARPDILFVGMGSPRKERFISDYKAIMEAPFVMGVGGSFDVMAGKVRRAPKWMQDGGMEWVFRLIQEPGRMWKRYLVTNIQFALALVEHAVSPNPRAANG